jgi:hypothetical protein
MLSIAGVYLRHCHVKKDHCRPYPKTVLAKGQGGQPQFVRRRSKLRGIPARSRIGSW